MSMAMSKAERESFLADVHIGVVSVNRQDDGPLSAPVWYMYEEGVVWFSTGADSRKGQLMKEGVPISLVAQTEKAPYQYVTVSGLIVERVAADVEKHIRPMAIRYLGERQGNAYADQSGAGNSVVISMRPDKWLSVDYSKAR